jgi:hypothetical protein
MSQPGSGIDGDVDLWRRVPAGYWTSGEGSIRVELGAFRNHPETGYMSMQLAAETDMAAFVRDFDGCAVVVLKASVLVGVGQWIERMPDDGPPGHVGVFGEKPKSAMKKAVRGGRCIYPSDCGCEPKS